MSKFIATYSLLTLCLGMFLGMEAHAKVVCDGKELTKLNTRVWDTVNNVEFFPETKDPEYLIPWVNDPERVKHSFGVVFSGGGTRSAAATLGQLRALHKLDWINKAQYLSAVSGGSWAAVPYIFADTDRLERLLGYGDSIDKYVQPEKIEDSILRDKDKLSLAYSISKSGVGRKLVGNLIRLRGDESYAHTLSSIFLDRFGLYDGKKFFNHESTIEKVLANNPNLSKDDFFLASKNRPYLLVGGVLFSRKEFSKGTNPQDVMFPFEMTPSYSGLSTYHAATKKNQLAQPIGGGFIESFGYDSCAPSSPVVHKGTASPWLERSTFSAERYKFSLGDMIAISGAAPAEVVATKIRYNSLSLPELMHWAIDTKAAPVTEELKHGDGGHIDNIGIMPFLARKIQNILVFVNTNTRYTPGDVTCAEIGVTCAEIMENVRAFFIKDEKRKQINIFEGEIFKKMIMEYNDDYKVGRPLVFCNADTKLKVDADVINRFNIKPDSDYKPNVCWVYLDRSMQWIHKIAAARGIDPVDHRPCNPKYAPNSLRCTSTAESGRGNGGKYVSRLVQQKKQFRHFPHYKTFLEQWYKLRVIDLKKVQVNALAQLTAWSVLSSEKEIGAALGLD